LVVFNKERYLKVKGIAESVARGLKKRKRFKNLRAKIKRIKPAAPKQNYNSYEPSKITLYAQSGSIWRWRRVNEWYKNLKDYYD